MITEKSFGIGTLNQVFRKIFSEGKVLSLPVAIREEIIKKFEAEQEQTKNHHNFLSTEVVNNACQALFLKANSNTIFIPNLLSNNDLSYKTTEEIVSTLQKCSKEKTARFVTTAFLPKTSNHFIAITIDTEAGNIFFDNSVDGGFGIIEDDSQKHILLGNHEEEFLFNNHQARKSDQEVDRFKKLPQDSAFANLFRALSAVEDKNFTTIFSSSDDQGVKTFSIKVGDDEGMEILQSTQPYEQIKQKTPYTCGACTWAHLANRTGNLPTLLSLISADRKDIFGQDSRVGGMSEFMIASSVLQDAQTEIVPYLKELQQSSLHPFPTAPEMPDSVEAVILAPTRSKVVVENVRNSLQDASAPVIDDSEEDDVTSSDKSTEQNHYKALDELEQKVKAGGRDGKEFFVHFNTRDLNDIQSFFTKDYPILNLDQTQIDNIIKCRMDQIINENVEKIIGIVKDQKGIDGSKMKAQKCEDELKKIIKEICDKPDKDGNKFSIARLVLEEFKSQALRGGISVEDTKGKGVGRMFGKLTHAVSGSKEDVDIANLGSKVIKYFERELSKDPNKNPQVASASRVTTDDGIGVFKV